MNKPVIPIANAERALVPVFTAPPPLGLYIHVPWCVRKCPYCDFNSHEIAPPRGRRETAPSPQGAKKHLGRPGVFLPTSQEDEYIAALIADLESALPQVWGRQVSSVFIGGGTPSLFSPQAYDSLLAAVRARVALRADAEITLEANPGTVEAEKFAGFRAAGINRVSLGIQSFDDAKLAALGRIHSSDEAKRAIELALRHFERVNLDLMYALPNQSLEEARRDIETGLSLGTEHLSAYHLTLEPNTPFHHKPPPLPEDDVAADMQEMVEELLEGAGYEHYETSAFAKPGARCRHNLNYWNFGDYLGIGAGAHGKITSHAGVVREMRRKHPRDYLAGAQRGDFVQERHQVEAGELPFEFMMNALRLCDGFPTRLFEERTGLPLALVHAQLLKAQREGLLDVTPDHIAPTARGRRFLNSLLREFL